MTLNYLIVIITILNYLEEIIYKVNDYINNGKEEEYIKENKIRFGRNETHYYLCCEFNENLKKEYYEKKSLNQKSYKDNENNEYNNIEIIKVEKKLKDNDQIKQEEKKESNNNYSKGLSSAKISKDNYIKKNSYIFEKEVKNFIYNEDCTSLQNLIFFFNLKIPKILNNNINFQSVRLSFESTSENSLYCFREIDI